MSDPIDRSGSEEAPRRSGVGAVAIRARGPRARLALGGCLLAVLAASASPALGHVPRHFYGIVPGGALKGRDFELMRRANVGSVRFGIVWPEVQPIHRGPFYWSSTDRIVARAAKHNISLLPILIGTPRYESRGCGGCVDHIDIEGRGQRRDWVAFVRATVQRYGRHGDFWTSQPDLPYDPITHWQIWNEQNNPNERNPAKVYARLLALTDRAISSTDRRGKIVAGGMPGVTNGGARTRSWNYLRALYEHGADKHLDAVALHPYSPDISGIRGQIKRIRRVMRHHHEGSTPILITEIGWGSGGKKHRFPGTGLRGQAFVVNAVGQKRKLTRSFGLLTRHRRSWRIGGVYWYDWKDPRNPPRGLCAFCYTSGLYAANGERPKPALSAFRRFTRKTAIVIGPFAGASGRSGALSARPPIVLTVQPSASSRR